MFRTKLEIALEQMRTAVEEGVPRGVVLEDAGYGNSTGNRDGITAIGLNDMGGIRAATTVRPLGEERRRNQQPRASAAPRSS